MIIISKLKILKKSRDRVQWYTLLEGTMPWTLQRNRQIWGRRLDQNTLLLKMFTIISNTLYSIIVSNILCDNLKRTENYFPKEKVERITDL